MDLIYGKELTSFFYQHKQSYGEGVTLVNVNKKKENRDCSVTFY